MISFELSAIDIILIVAVVVLLILHITRPSEKNEKAKQLFVDREQLKKPVVAEKMLEREEKIVMPTEQRANTFECRYGLTRHQKWNQNTSIPDKCLSCHEIMECYASNE